MPPPSRRSAGAEYAGTAWLYGHEVQASAIVTESSISITSVGLVPFTCDDMPFKPVAPEVEIEDETVNDLELLSTCLADALAQYGHDHAAGSDTDTDAAGPAPLMKLASLQLVPDRSIKLSFSYRDALPVSVYLERMHAGQELARQAEREGEYVGGHLSIHLLRPLLTAHRPMITTCTASTSPTTITTL